LPDEDETVCLLFGDGLGGVRYRQLLADCVGGCVKGRCDIMDCSAMLGKSP